MTTAAKPRTVARVAIRNCLSSRRGSSGRNMFSEKVTEGASSVPEAVDMIADSRAPKNMI